MYWQLIGLEKLSFHAVQRQYCCGFVFRSYLDLDISLQTDTVHKFADHLVSNSLCVVNELRRLFLVEDMVDSLKVTVSSKLKDYHLQAFRCLSALLTF